MAYALKNFLSFSFNGIFRQDQKWMYIPTYHPYPEVWQVFFKDFLRGAEIYTSFLLDKYSKSLDWEMKTRTDKYTVLFSLTLYPKGLSSCLPKTNKTKYHPPHPPPPPTNQPNNNPKSPAGSWGSGLKFLQPFRCAAC